MASRKDEKERRRQERLERERTQADEARRRRLYAIVAGSLLALAAVVAVVVAIAAGGGDGDGGGGGGQKLDVDAVAPPVQQAGELNAAAKAADCRLENPPIEGRTHVEEDDVKYKTNPPTSGNHYPIPAEDGAYAGSPPINRLVHSLEHGRILVWYDPAIPRRRLGQLKGLFDEDPYHMIVVPNRRMPYKVAATAWGHLAGCRKVTDETFDLLRAFRDRYRDKGPEFAA
jgi:hypothetical protein